MGSVQAQFAVKHTTPKPKNSPIPQSGKPLTKHQLKSETTRSALLQTAEKIFARDGFERAQIDEIAKDSGRTRGAVYAQYKTKEQLFFAVQEQRIRTATEDLFAIIEKIGKADYAGRLSAVRSFYSGLGDSQAAILDLELKLFALRHPESLEAWRERYRVMFPRGGFARQFGLVEQRGRSKIRNRVTTLAAAKSGIVLAMLFLPDQFSARETKLILGEVFDGLFPVSKP